MILTLDVGNSHIYGGVFSEEKLILDFRKPSSYTLSSDEMGVFFRAVLRENGIDYKEIKQISICSVVPDIEHSLNNSCRKYFSITPFFVKAGIKTGLNIKVKSPSEVGADRIANALAAAILYPEKNLIVIDFGTATTLCVINKNKEYLGGVIAPGLRLCMEALDAKTAKLSKVEIVRSKSVVGKNTVESIQSGLYYSQLGLVKELVSRITQNEFKAQKPIVIGTGGFSRLYEHENLFDHLDSDLVHKGLNLALKLNF